jgi:glycosyltransferase involved in cell wall biosynthesis
MANRTLTAIPAYNEAAHLTGAVAGALTYSREVLVVVDDIHLIHHQRNLGYGAALRSAFTFALQQGYDVLVTIDCDGQHQPQLIPRFVEPAQQADIVSGSRYLRRFPGDSVPLEQRRGPTATRKKPSRPWRSCVAAA